MPRCYVFCLNEHVKRTPLFRLPFLVAVISGSTLLPLCDAVTAPPPSVEAKITFGNGETAKLYARDWFQPIAIAPGDTATIQVQLPQQLTDVPSVVQALDGGEATDVVISPDGIASTSFHVGTEPGAYRLLLSARGRSVVLEFRVANQG